MLPILPWMPATVLVLGLDNKDLQRASERIAMKTQAMAKNLHDKAPVIKWDTIARWFDHCGVHMTFETQSAVNHNNFTTTISIKNEVRMREDVGTCVTIAETMTVVFDDYRNKTPLEHPAKTACAMEIILSDPLPESVVAHLNMKPLRDVIQMSSAFDAILGSRRILSASADRFNIDISDFEQEATELHDKFQESLPAF